MCGTMAKNDKTAAETTTSIRLPVDLVEIARELSAASEGHALGKRTAAEILASAARAGLPTVRAALRAKVAR